MQRKLALYVVLALAAAVPLAAWATDTPAAAAAPHHTAMAPGDVKFGPAPPALPPGSLFAVLQGDPSKEGPFIIRASLPDGYKVPPHWHPTTENVTVLAGTFHVAAGDTFDSTKGDALTAGGFASLPANMHHYAWAEGPTLIQVNGMGPFELTYVNPADDPRSAPAKP